MTKTEILEKIDKGLRGQGNQVDIGNVLADVLSEIVNPIPLSLKLSNLSGEGGGEAMTLAEFCTKLEITEAQAKALVSGEYPVLKLTEDDNATFLTLTSWAKDGTGNSARYLQGADANDMGFMDCLFAASAANYFITFVSV